MTENYVLKYLEFYGQSCIHLHIYFSHILFSLMGGKVLLIKLLAMHKNKVLFKWTPSAMMRSEGLCGWKFKGGSGGGGGGGSSGIFPRLIC